MNLRTDVTFELPYPPSVNNYWRHVGSRTLISRAGRQYRKDLEAAVLSYSCATISGPIRLDILAHPPDARRRDIDNILKPLLDGLAHGGVYHDDSQVVRMSVEKLDPAPPDGLVYVRVRKWYV